MVIALSRIQGEGLLPQNARIHKNELDVPFIASPFDLKMTVKTSTKRPIRAIRKHFTGGIAHTDSP